MPTPSRPTPPLGADAALAAGWTPEEGRLAVDAHKRGTLLWSWQLAIDAPSYPPIKAALEQRLASPLGLPWEVEGPSRAPGRIETEAARGIWCRHLERLVRSTLKDLIMMGLSVWHHPTVVNPDTLRTEIAPFMIGGDEDVYQVGRGGVQRWPISAVGYTATPIRGVIGYYAITQGGGVIQLPRPGESSEEWTVVGEGDQPHLDGAITALDQAFTGGMLAWRARLNLGSTAGRASLLMMLPPSVPTQTTDASGLPTRGISEDAQEVLAAVGTEQANAVFPNGTTFEKFELAMTGAADFFHTDLLDSILMVALAVMGRGGALAKTDAQYQGPAEMDVPESLIRRDVRAIERAASGLFAMLTRANAGSRVKSPTLCGHLPDTDQETRYQDLANRRKLYLEELAAEKALGIPMTQEHADELALEYDVLPIVVPPQAETSAEVFAYDLDNLIITINEQRALKGLAPVAWGDIPAPEAKAKIAAGWRTSPEGWIPPVAPPAQPA